MKHQHFTFHIRHIGVFSAFKVGCLTTALSLTGLFLCMMITILPFAIVTRVDMRPWIAGITITPLIFIVAAIVYGFGPGLVLAYHAIIYNIIARFFGGLVVNLEREQASTDAPEPAASNVRTLSKEEDELNRQIRARQARIAEINAQLSKASKP